MGFGQVPKREAAPIGYYFGSQPIGGRTVGGAQVARSLGYQPRLIRDIGTDKIYFREPSGALRWIPNPDLFMRSGFRGEDVFNVASSELPEFGPLGMQLNEPPPIVEGGVRRYPLRTTPLVTPPAAGNIALPDPRQIAGIWRFLDPSTRNALVSAYGVGGLGTPEQSLQAIQEAVRFFSPVGTQQRAGTARLG